LWTSAFCSCPKQLLSCISVCCTLVPAACLHLGDAEALFTVTSHRTRCILRTCLLLARKIFDSRPSFLVIFVTSRLSHSSNASFSTVASSSLCGFAFSSRAFGPSPFALVSLLCGLCIRLASMLSVRDAVHCYLAGRPRGLSSLTGIHVPFSRLFASLFHVHCSLVSRGRSFLSVACCGLASSGVTLTS